MKRVCSCRLILGAILAVIWSGTAAAQTPDPFDNARHRRGALAATPELLLLNVGIDSNVFNEALNPRSDFIFTVRPGSDIWLRAGRMRLEGRTQVALNYFAQYETERSADNTNRARLSFRTQRFIPFVQAGFVTARDRLTPEIDVRVRRQEKSVAVGSDVLLGPKTIVRVGYDHFDTNFNDRVAAGAFAASLDRRETAANASVRYRLTPLTTLVFEGERRVNVFDAASERDATGVRATPGVEFSTGALIQGRAVMGYQRFDFDSSSVRDFTGLVASIDLAYAPRPNARIGFTAERNLEYSFDILQPYYVASGIGANVTQQFSERWSGLARVARRRLNYRQALPRPTDPRIDGVTQLTAGVGFRLGLRSRAEALVALNRRDSLRRDREYTGVRLGSSLIYEF